MFFFFNFQLLECPRVCWYCHPMQHMEENKMGVKPIASLLFSMGIPIMISMMIQALYNVIDSIFISRIGENALTAVSLAFPVQIIMIAIGIGTAVGVNALLSRRLGEKRPDKASDVAMHGLLLAVILAASIAIFGATLPFWFIRMFTDDPQIVDMGNTYLVIITVFSLGMFGQLVLERIMQGTGDTIHPMITQGLGAIINIILDPILIFGYFGLPAMGIKGAAVATVIGQSIGMLLGVYFLLTKIKVLTISFSDFKVRRKTLKGIYRVGLPSIIMQSIGSVMSVGMNSILIGFSSTAVAVFGVYFKLQSFIFMPLFGLTTAMISIVAFNFGAKNKKRITGTIKLTALIAFCIMSLGTILFNLFPVPLLKMFDASDEMLQIGVAALKTISLHFPIAAIAIVLSVSFQAMGKGSYSLMMSVVRQLVVLLPAAYLLARNGGINMTWYAFIIAEGFSIAMALIFFSRLYRTKIAVLEPA